MFCFGGHVPASARTDDEYQPDGSQDGQHCHFISLNTSLYNTKPAGPKHPTAVPFHINARSVPVFNTKFQKNWPPFMENNCQTLFNIRVFREYWGVTLTIHPPI
jgi:hypothetical protein